MIKMKNGLLLLLTGIMLYCLCACVHKKVAPEQPSTSLETPYTQPDQVGPSDRQTGPVAPAAIETTGPDQAIVTTTANATEQVGPDRTASPTPVSDDALPPRPEHLKEDQQTGSSLEMSRPARPGKPNRGPDKNTELQTDMTSGTQPSQPTKLDSADASSTAGPTTADTARPDRDQADKASSSTSIDLPGDDKNEIIPLEFPEPPPEYDPYGDAIKIAGQPDADQLISLNFNNEPIESLLKALFADTLKLNYILDSEVSGNITIVTKTPFPKKDLFDVILLVLKLNGFAVTRAGDYYLIIPTGEVMKYMLPTKSGEKAEDIKPSERIISQVVQLKYLSTADVTTIITPMKSDDTQLITLDAANIIIFTGPASNIRRMMEMIEVMDIETSQEEFRIFQIKYADANDIMSTLQTLFQKKVGRKSVPGQSQSAASHSRRTDRSKATGRATSEPGIMAVGGGSDEPVIIVDERSNSLMVFGSARDMEFIQRIIDIFDVDMYSHQEIFIYYVENAEAAELKTILEDLYKGQKADSKKNKGTSGASWDPSVNRYRDEKTGKFVKGPAESSEGSTTMDTHSGEIIGDFNISVDERTNALIIQSTYRNYKILENMIKKLDVVPKQVLIEVLIVEVTLDDSMNLGFQWNLRSEGTVGDNTFSSTTSTNFGVGEGTGVNWTVFEPTRFNSILNAFAADSRIEILSNPHLLCSNNTEAKIQIGDEVPTLTSQAVNQTGTVPTNQNYNYYTSQVEYLSTGIILAVKARVNEARMVSIEINQEVSEAQQNELADINSPTIRKRVLETSVTVRDNQTIVMGGLMSNKKTNSDQGIPLLSKIPFLRWLFGSESRETTKKELILFITPHVIGTPFEIYEKTMEFMDKLPRVEKLREKNEK